MAWDFSTEPEFQEKLDWIATVRDGRGRAARPRLPRATSSTTSAHPVHDEVVAPLQEQVKEQDLWACHLGPELGGKGYGQLKLGADERDPRPVGLGAERLRLPGARLRQRRDPRPLRHARAEGGVPASRCSTATSSSCFSMTEPQAGADPKQFRCRAMRDGDDWVITARSGSRRTSGTPTFAIVMAVTDPDVPVYQGASMFLVPDRHARASRSSATSGLVGEPRGRGLARATSATTTCACPARTCSAARARASSSPRPAWAAAASTTPCARSAMCKRAFDMMCERALSRTTQGELLAQKQMVQEQIADSWIQLQQFRLQVLHAAWVLDQRAARRRPAAPPSRA